MEQRFINSTGQGQPVGKLHKEAAKMLKILTFLTFEQLGSIVLRSYLIQKYIYCTIYLTLRCPKQAFLEFLVGKNPFGLFAALWYLIMWLFSPLDCRNFFLHLEQAKGFSFVCILSSVFIVCDSENFLSQ